MTSDNPFEDAPENNNHHGWRTDWEWRPPADMKVAAPLLDVDVDKILMENSDVPISEYHAAKRAINREHRAKHGRLSFRDN